MSEISSIADATFIKLLIIVVGGCVGIVNALGFFILNGIKKSINDLWSKFNKDHDRLNRLETEHNIFHPKNNVPPADLQ